MVLMGAVGGYFTYTTHIEPRTTTETREVSSWQSSGTFSHQATVINETTAFSEGTVLQNRSAYFRGVSPKLNGTFRYAYEAQEGNLTTETTVLLKYRAVEPADDGNGTTYWDITRPIAQDRTEALRPTERVTVPFSTNASAAIERVQRIDNEHGNTPGQLGIAVIARVDVSGTRNGQRVDTTNTYRLPIIPDDSVYRVADPGVVTASGSQTEQVTVPVEYGALRRVGSPLLLSLAVGSLLGLLYARQTGRLSVSEAERRWADYRTARAEYDDWITSGHLPSDTDEMPAITVDSLEGLVDVAIDTNTRVIENVSHDQYVVFVDNRLYRYEPPLEPTAEGDDGRASDEHDSSSDQTKGGMTRPSRVQANTNHSDNPKDH
ncbi:hypothetical protein GOC83_10080 [Haloarcula rubripromontorii]|uniref:DUF5305 domain-containing protein n=2 Tax=Haloarcula rubripromontorii TaxID=1705562 RepID=A0A847TZH1_9EURY|nr:hypothetical protein [Haloarcula rubripromontorii]